MKPLLSILVLSAIITQPVKGAIKQEIAVIDRQMIRSRQLAEIDAESARKNAIGAFLRTLPHLERQYRNSGNQDGVLACRKVRAKYDPKAEKTNRPTKLHDQLVKMVFSLELQLKKLDRIERDKIIAAKSGRARKLMALQRGLVKRGDREGSRLVIEALKTPVAVPPPPVSLTNGKEKEREAIAVKKISLLTYNRAKKRWQELEGGRVDKSVSNGTTTLHYVEGEHWLLKALWPNVLEAGSRFSVEVKGVFSVGVIDLEGHDANAHFSFPKTDGFVKVEIERAKDSVTFTCNGQRKTTKYMSGKLRGEAARAAMISHDLRVTISTKKGEKASFRNAKLMKP